MIANGTYHFAIYIILLLVGLALQYLYSYKSNTLKGHGEWKKFIFFNLIIIAILILFYSLPKSTCYLHSLIVVLGFYELFKSKVHPFFIVLFAVVGAAFFYSSVILTSLMLINVLLLTAVFDGYSQLTGKLVGKHKITKTSPNKTWEGFVGGAFTLYLVAAVLAYLGVENSLAFIASLPFVALLGDLSASFIKRKTQLKDFSQLLPGQGGVLDRFDSYIATSIWALLFHFLT
jgi:phosphatidate cytidylyltransferase